VILKTSSILTVRNKYSTRLVASGFGFVEGPVYLPTEGYWLFSDLKANKVYRWSVEEGLTVAEANSSYANGHAVDREGHTLYRCEHGSRSVVSEDLRTGLKWTVASHHEGRPLTSPNDVVVNELDGSIWFTDPDYGCQACTHAVYPIAGS